MSSTLRFSDLSLPQPLLDALETKNYQTPSPIQEQAIPLLMNGQDLIAQAQTGTGKTAAFALPLLSGLDLTQKNPQVLVLAPTRELAIQVAESFDSYAQNIPGFKSLCIYGGQSYSNQLRGLKQGVHVVVGTPGRVNDHIKRGTLKLGELQSLVLDEADEMLRMGFLEEIETIINATPEDRHMVMFSATMPAPIKKIAKRYLNDAAEVKIAAKTTTVESVSQHYVLLFEEQKTPALCRILEMEDDGSSSIVFVRTKNATMEVAKALKTKGFSASALNGDMSQAERERTIQRLKNRSVQIVVATDVAARGLDVNDLGLVVNFDTPYDSESYVHRIGRTGRAGNQGRAILFITPSEQRTLKFIERDTRQPLELLALPTNEELQTIRMKKLENKVANSFSQDLHEYDQVLKNLQERTGLSVEQMAPALLHLAQKRQSLVVNEKEIHVPDASKEKRRSEKRKAEKRERSGKMPRNSDFGKPFVRSEVDSDRQEDFDKYRIEVGRRHKASVSDIVGAIANEAGIENRYIGKIKLFQDHSTIELPKGMPKQIFKHLQRTSIRQRRLRISLLG